MLFGGLGATRTLAGLGGPSSPVVAPVRCRTQGLRSAAACTPHRLRRRVAQEATPAVGRLCNVPLRWLCAGRFAAIQGGFLRCAWSAADLTPGGCGPGSSRAAGAAPALGPRLDLTGSPGPAAATLGRGAPPGQHRRLPLPPAVLRQRLPFRGKESITASRCVLNQDATFFNWHQCISRRLSNCNNAFFSGICELQIQNARHLHNIVAIEPA